jgi:L-lactate dehydrogenase complex protein LldF
MEPRAAEFRRLSEAALANAGLRKAIATANSSFRSSREAAIAAVPEWEDLRERAARIKDEAIARLPEALERRLIARGAQVHWAADGAEAATIIAGIARKAGARIAVKSKSMVSEEIGLNEALAAAGTDPVETDLGEFIVQLAGQTPSHIIAPAIHMSRREIAALLHDRIGSPAGADIPVMTLAARKVLREKFLAAGIGISGVNFAVAETGTLVVVENEGNARLSTTLPRVHVALMGIEKVVPRLADLAVLLKLLTRSATGQPISSYVSWIGGPRGEGEVDGPEEVHLVILDAGRSRIWADPGQREALRCIRCGACLNDCPVYERIGGHAYGWVYPGPIGSAITPGLIGIDRSRDLPRASSLCGRCGEVCPVKIPLPSLLIRRRFEDVERGRPGPGASDRLAMKAFAAAASRPWLFGFVRAAGRTFLRLALARNPAARLLGPLRAWTLGRNFPRPPAESFRSAWRRGAWRSGAGALPGSDRGGAP